jgi:hypothetical protein
MRIGEGGVHLGDLFGELSDVLVRGALGGEGGYIGFEDETGFEHLPREEAVEGTEDGEGTGVECWRSAGDEGSGAVAALEDSHGREEADAGAEAGATDFELSGKVALGWEAVARLYFAAGNEATNVLDYLHGELAVAGGVIMRVFLYLTLHLFLPLSPCFALILLAGE